MKTDYEIGQKVRVISADGCDSKHLDEEGIICHEADFLKVKMDSGGCIFLKHSEVELVNKPEPITEQEIYQNAIEAFGDLRQVDKFIEETGELLQALSKYKYDPSDINLKNVRSEIADVKITVNQVAIIFNDKEVEKDVRCKLERLVLLTKKQVEKNANVDLLDGLK